MQRLAFMKMIRDSLNVEFYIIMYVCINERGTSGDSIIKDKFLPIIKLADFASNQVKFLTSAVFNQLLCLSVIDSHMHTSNSLVKIFLFSLMWESVPQQLRESSCSILLSHFLHMQIVKIGKFAS